MLYAYFICCVYFNNMNQAITVMNMQCIFLRGKKKNNFSNTVYFVFDLLRNRTAVILSLVRLCNVAQCEITNNICIFHSPAATEERESQTWKAQATMVGVCPTYTTTTQKIKPSQLHMYIEFAARNTASKTWHLRSK